MKFVDWNGKNFILRIVTDINEEEARELVERRDGPLLPCSTTVRSQLERMKRMRGEQG